MAKEEILEMEAGKELDELIEQHLFRLVRGHREDGSRCWKDSEGYPVQSEAKPYSTDISAAWQVVENLIEQDYDVRIDYDAEQQLWICHLTSETVEEWSKSKAAPEAICKAALLAKWA